MGLFDKKATEKEIKELMDTYKGIDKRFVAVNDAYSNPQLNLGFGTKDNMQATTFVPNHKTWNWLEINQIERSEPLFIKIVDYFASGYVNGGDITSVNLNNEEIKVIQSKLEEIKVGLYETYYQSIFYGGGAGLLIFANETKDEDFLKPLDIKKVKKNSFLGIKPLERWQGIFPDMMTRVETIGKDGIYDPSELGQPLYYKVRLYEVGGITKEVKVHRSRLIIHNPIYLPYIQKQIERYWSSSIVESLYDSYSIYLTERNAVANMLINSNTRILKMEDTTGSAELTKRATENLKMKFKLMSESLNFSNMVVVDKEDDLELLTCNFANIPDILKKASYDLANSAGVPPSVLFGEGFDNVQESENSHRVLKNRQELHIKKDYMKLIKIICKSSLGKDMPTDLKFTFNNICKINDKDKASIIADATNSLTQVYKSGAMDTETYIRSLTEINSNINDIFDNYKEEFVEREGGKTYTERQIEIAYALNKPTDANVKETFSANNKDLLENKMPKVDVNV